MHREVLASSCTLLFGVDAWYSGQAFQRGLLQIWTNGGVFLQLYVRGSGKILQPFPTLVVGCHVILSNRGRSTGTCNIYAVNVMNFSLRLVVAGGVSETNTISAPIAHPLIPCSDVAATLQDT